MQGRAVAVVVRMPSEPGFRDYLTRDEVAALLRAAEEMPALRCAHNYAMTLVAYRHGLRASELVKLPVSDLDLAIGAGSVNFFGTC